jgi:signal transduction histidine kinase/CheY-like chemotaxis protein
MSMNNVSVERFLQSVSICEQTTNWGKLVKIFRTDGDRLVVVNAQGYPMGIVKLAKLLPNILNYEHEQTTQDISLQQFMQPVTVFQAEMSLDQLYQQLKETNITEQEFVIVNEEGQVLGLLNCWQLLNDLTKKENLNYAGDGLVSLLAKIPIPLSLQSSNGEIITHNLSWSEQIGDIFLTSQISVETSKKSEKLPNNDEALMLSSFLAIEAENNAKLSALLQGEVQAQIITTINKGEEYIWQLVKVPFLVEESFSQSEKNLWLVMAQDITEQQQIAKELAAKNADLIQLNRLKDEFLACVSHELKTPLTSVLGLSSMLKEQLIGQLNERQARYVSLIHQSGKQLMNVVNDILDLTRMETGQMQLSVDVVNIANVCDRAYNQALQLQKIKPDTDYQIKFNLEIEPNLETIIADEVRLRQMLINLLSNALKFSELHGEISLQVNHWEGWIAFTISDTGIGIPPEKQHLIFQKFQQLENPLTRQFEGAGLGLVLTQRLARLHGGDVSFISNFGHGSKFTLLLPPQPPQTEDENKKIIPRTNINRLVLIVETVPEYIENLTTQISNLGYRIIIARSGTEALEKARRLQPVLILLNPLLPMLSGWDLLTLLKTDKETKHIPVLVTTTKADKNLAYAHRADDFLTIPVQKNDLSKSINKLIKKPEQSQKIITVLHLFLGANTPFSSYLNYYSLPRDSRYQVLEVNDLLQANLLAKIWHIDVILLNIIPEEKAINYLQDLNRYQILASLPIVTIDLATTQAANQIKGLSVFPCLLANQYYQNQSLWQVIEFATGMNNKAIIVIFSVMPKLSKNVNDINKKDEWLSALNQYLIKAGFKIIIVEEWEQLNKQIEHQNVDLLMIHLGENTESKSLIYTLKFLGKMHILPPIVVLDHRSEIYPSENNAKLESILKTVAHKIIKSPPTSMADLLTEINTILHNKNNY